MIDIINEGIVFKVSDDHKVQTELFDDIGVLVVDNFYKNPDLVRKLIDDIPATTHTNRGGYPAAAINVSYNCLLYTSPSPRDATLSRMPSSA